MRKEVQIDSKLFWELEQTGSIQAFPNLPKVIMWSDHVALTHTRLLACLGKNLFHRPECFLDENGRLFEHCVLLLSEHEKKSRRCTVKELSKWVLGGNGFWLDLDGNARTLGDFNYTKSDDECGKIVISICTWDGKPMEPTAQNMGLEE